MNKKKRPARALFFMFRLDCLFPPLLLSHREHRQTDEKAETRAD